MSTGKNLINHIKNKFKLVKQWDVAQLTGLDEATIHRLYHGKMKVNSTHILIIYDTCQMSIEEIRECLK